MTLAAILCCAMTTSVFTACSSDNDDNPTPNPTEDLVDYTVIFYGQGGANLDAGIMGNINQFFLADASSFKKVNVVGQFKFSTAENLMTIMSEDYATKLGSKTYRFAGKSKVENEEAWMDDANIYGADNCDCTNPDSLTNFINWAAKTCPAKNYVLILSDHGGGYMPPIGSALAAPSVVEPLMSILRSESQPRPSTSTVPPHPTSAKGIPHPIVCPPCRVQTQTQG